MSSQPESKHDPGDLYWVCREDDVVVARLAKMLGKRMIETADDLDIADLILFHDILRGADDVAHAHIVEQVRRLTRKDSTNANVRGRRNDQAR